VLRRIGALTILLMLLLPPPHADADGPTGGCISSHLGGAIICNGQYVVNQAGKPAPAPAPPPTAPPTTSQFLVEYVAYGPNGPCIAFGPPHGMVNERVMQFLGTVSLPPCPKMRKTPVPVDPAALAVQFWKTIPLPVPRPSIPPGYAITGKPAYLVTNGQTAPGPYVFNTPIGTLTISPHGEYSVDWGDGSSPTWTGPYYSEGQPWPDGDITHTFDYVGSYDVVIGEGWTATWSLAGVTGNLGGLRTTATITAFPVQQVQAVITN
jgi:hypothetical protein